MLPVERSKITLSILQKLRNQGAPGTGSTGSSAIGGQYDTEDQELDPTGRIAQSSPALGGILRSAGDSSKTPPSKKKGRKSTDAPAGEDEEAS